MAGNRDNEFNAGAYWAERVQAGADLATVGHRSMGAVYNAEIYARRIEVLESILHRHVNVPAKTLRVLDVGCGSGFYTGFWHARGVEDYVGLDISTSSIDSLSRAYPNYKFVQADISAELTRHWSSGEPFDVITVFDVLYHVVDDHLFESALTNIASLVKQNGQVMVMDQLCRRQYQLSKHVCYRARDHYLAMCEARGLSLVDSELLFHFLVPPITEMRPIDYLTAGAFRVLGFVIRRFDNTSARVARSLRRLDKLLRERGKRVSNSEMFVFEKTHRPPHLGAAAWS